MAVKKQPRKVQKAKVPLYVCRGLAAYGGKRPTMYVYITRGKPKWETDGWGGMFPKTIQYVMCAEGFARATGVKLKAMEVRKLTVRVGK